jgi:hypothetical protein
MNIVRVDLKTGDKNPTVSSWNRITYADFHALDRMLTVVFADAKGSILPVEARSPRASTPPAPPAPPAASGSTPAASGSAAK